MSAPSTAAERQQRPPVALLTYSNRPRGGVVHTLALAEALHAAGWPVHVFALGDPEAGFFRQVAAPHTLVPAPEPAPTLTERVFDAIDALSAGLLAHLPPDVEILHSQDCIAARAAARVRAARGRGVVVRTVHHVDEFTTPALIECQERSITEPDALLVVSAHWLERLHTEYGVSATVVGNGVRAGRFATAPANPALRRRLDVNGQFLYLTVGGLEPRKGSLELIEALAAVRAHHRPAPHLAVVGGHSFQDHKPYRDRCLRRVDQLGLGDGLSVVGTVADDELPCWYRTADAFVFPSVNEGWGLVVLEAMAAGLPVVVSDLPVFAEYLDDGDALMVPTGDADALAEAMLRLATDARLRHSLARRGPEVARRHTWERCAQRHGTFYSQLVDSRG